MDRPARNYARRVALPMLAVIAVTLAACSSSSTGASSTSGTAAKTSSHGGAPIVVGAMGSFTGPASGSTADTKIVFQDWVDATNASGGINGHPVKAIILDDQNSPSTSLSNAQELVSQDHVQVIFDLSDDLESTWSSVVDSANVPVLGQSESPVLGSNTDFYPTGTTVLALIWGELAAAHQAKVSKLAALYCAEIASCSETVPLITNLGPSLGVSLAYSAKVSSSASSYTAQCLGAQSAGAKGVTVVAASDTALSVAESCATQGYKPVWVSTAGEMTTPWLKQPAMNGAIGNVQDAPWFASSTPALEAMQTAIQKYSPGLSDSSSFGATATIGWAAGVVFASVAKTADLGPTSSTASLITALHGVSNDTFGGMTPPLTYPVGKAATVPCSFLAGIKNGNWSLPIGLSTVCQPAG